MKFVDVVFLALWLVAMAVADLVKPPPSLPPVLAFSAGFSSDMVLQRNATTKVYGFVRSTSALVHVTVVNERGSLPMTAAVVTAPSPQGIQTNDGEWPMTWEATLPSMPTSFSDTTIVVVCINGCDNTSAYMNETIVLERVSFGDVFFCSGQSNMALPLVHTFSSPVLTESVLKGHYSNLRIFTYGGMSVGSDVRAYGPKYVTTDAAHPWANVSWAVAQPEPLDKKGNKILNTFHTYSATCMYFGTGLTDLLGKDAPPIGLMTSAVGGSMIEAWMENATHQKCRKTSDLAIEHNLYYGMVGPFLNMTVKGWVWYQGENNVGGDPGNSAQGEGYGCAEPALVQQWRTRWSESSGTASDAPFGVVTLAAGTSEGHGAHMAPFRWSQMANFGTLPSSSMPNTFLAHAFDLGDPWANSASYRNNCSKPDPSTGKYGPNCVAWNDNTWNPQIRNLAPLVRNNSAPFYMGPIHPRFKREVGRRLAVAYLKNISGPVLRGCSAQDATIQLRFDLARLGGEDVVVDPAFPQNGSDWAGLDSNSLLVCTDRLGGNVTSCSCLGWNYLYPWDAPHGDFWYCEEGPGWKPDRTTRRDSELLKARVQHRARGNPFDANWQPAPLRATKDADGRPVVEVDLSKVNGTVIAMRYAWGGNHGDQCCVGKAVSEGFEVCRPASCPIMSADTWLPMAPFHARLVGGRCQCPPPQNCDDKADMLRNFVV